MSQYLNFVFNFVNCILISVIMSQSICEENSLEIILLNNSMLEIVESFKTNSSLLSPNQMNSKWNNTFYSKENREYCNKKESTHCSMVNDVDQICCPFSNNSRPVCVSAKYIVKCRGISLNLLTLNQHDH